MISITRACVLEIGVHLPTFAYDVQELTLLANVFEPQIPTLTNTKNMAPNNYPTKVGVPQENSQVRELKNLWTLGRTPIKVHMLEKLLRDYPCRVAASELLTGFKSGFRLHYQGPRIPTTATNLASALQHSDILNEKLRHEVFLGRMAGPFDTSPISTLHISPVGLVPKKDGGMRLITHLSHPPQGSINDFIDPATCSVHYSSFDQVLQMISKLGQSALIGKMDIKSAFRLLPVNPADFDCLGIKFQNKFYIDKCLPMGCSVSCSLFEKFSTFLEWAVKKDSRSDSIDHYLDDFIFAGRKGRTECRDLMHNFEKVCFELGVPLACDKTEGPTTVLVFLGLEIDTDKREIRIPGEKVCALKELLNNFLSKKSKISLKELQSFTGILAFCSRAIPAARAFNRRFYDAMGSAKLPHHLIRITKGMREDAHTWLRFVQQYNGTCHFPDQTWFTNDALQLFTDSAGNMHMGCAAYFRGKWACLQWPATWRQREILADITFLELVPILLALHIWQKDLQNKKILFRSDNQALVCILNKLTSKSPRVMSLIRESVLIAMSNNIQFKAKHIPGVQNEIADALSRFQWERFRKLAPMAEPHSTDVPKEFLQMLSTMK